MGFSIPLSHWFRDGLKTVFMKECYPSERSWPTCLTLSRSASGGHSTTRNEGLCSDAVVASVLEHWGRRLCSEDPKLFFVSGWRRNIFDYCDAMANVCRKTLWSEVWLAPPSRIPVYLPFSADTDSLRISNGGK